MSTSHATQTVPVTQKLTLVEATNAVLKARFPEVLEKLYYVKTGFGVEKRLEYKIQGTNEAPTYGDLVEVFIRYGEEAPAGFKGQNAAGFKLQVMHHNSPIIVSSNAFVQGSTTCKGLHQLLMDFREDIAKSAGGSALVCTTREDNYIQNHCLIKRKWKMVDKIWAVDRYAENPITVRTPVLFWKKELR